MALKTRKKVKKPADVCTAPKESDLKVFDIDIDALIDSEENPNEMDDTAFDELVDGIKTDGFDEPCLVMPIYEDDGKTPSGKYILASGHHRTKAARVAGMRTVPCIIKTGWDDQARKIALVRRNMLRGGMNPEKFTKLYNELSKSMDRELLKLQMGFTKKDAFDKVYKSVEKSLPQSAKKKLAEAKENIKSVDDLSSVLNTIFKEHGSELDHGFMVFSFGGKNHHYIKIDKEADDTLKRIEKAIASEGLDAGEVFKTLLKGFDLSEYEKSTTVKSVATSKPKRKRLKGRPKNA